MIGSYTINSICENLGVLGKYMTFEMFLANQKIKRDKMPMKKKANKYITVHTGIMTVP
jgi:hypothetical protein